MSHCEWESGHFTLTVDAFDRFVKTFCKKWNYLNEKDLQALLQVYEITLEKAKQVRKPNWEELFFQELNRTFGYNGGVYDINRKVYELSISDHDVLLMLFYSSPNEKGKREKVLGKPYKPKKSMFQNLSPNKLRNCNNDYAYATFDEKKQAICWRVAENNHAISDARQSKLGRVFFATLATVEWKGKNSGVIYVGGESEGDGETAYSQEGEVFRRYN